MMAGPLHDDGPRLDQVPVYVRVREPRVPPVAPLRAPAVPEKERLPGVVVPYEAGRMPAVQPPPFPELLAVGIPYHGRYRARAVRQYRVLERKLVLHEGEVRNPAALREVLPVVCVLPRDARAFAVSQ